jgi:hypothetical protein
MFSLIFTDTFVVDELMVSISRDWGSKENWRMKKYITKVEI